MVSAFTWLPDFLNFLVSKISEQKIANGITTPKDKTPLNPYSAINPGLIMKVAALVIEAARANPTARGEKLMLPIA